MRTQAKPFIVQIKKRKRTGADDSRPVRSLFGPVAKELAEELAGTGSRFGRGGDANSANIRGEEQRAGTQPLAAPSAWPLPANPPAAPANSSARVLPDLSRHERAEPEEEIVAREPRIRRKRRYTRKTARTGAPAPVVTIEEPVAAPVVPAPSADNGSGETEKRVRRQRFKWSSWRSRRSKTDASSPAQPPRGQRRKRRLPRAAR